MALEDIIKLAGTRDLKALGDEDFVELMEGFLATQEQDRMECNLRYYVPVSTKARDIHFSKASVVGIGGGNGSSKTETSIVEMCMCATGVFPEWMHDMLGDDGIREKYQGPMKCRVIVKSLKNQLDTIMLNKLKWFQWTGLLPEGGDKGHWGWIPRKCLIGGSWEKSWSAGTSTLKFYSFDPITEQPRGMSSIQFMSSDQEALAMAGNDLQFAMLDEPSTLAIWRETQARVMRGNGRIFLAMTWPDDPSIPVDWIFDEVYDRAEKDPDVEWVELSSFDNKNLDQTSVKRMAARVSEEVRKVRYEGKPMRFSNLIHPGFVDTVTHWCFECAQEVSVIPADDGPPVCMTCKGTDVTKYCHVVNFETQPGWPVVFLLDPHPRKPHMWLWAQIDPSNDIWVVADGALDREPADVAELATRVEAQFGLYVAARLMDPNMGKQPCGKRREVSWQDEFAMGGLYCDLADDSGVGRSRINERLKPDPDTYAPRIHIHPRCRDTIYQMKRYAWDEHRLSAEKDQKQVPKPKHDDYPTLLKYLVNFGPDFRMLSPGQSRIIKTRIIR